MATPSYKSEPAMALTAIQGNGTNVFDAPTVYTTNTQEVSTLTVDVKGSTMTIATSNTFNPTYTVQYYANIESIDNTNDGTGTHSVEVINTDGKGAPPTNSTISQYPTMRYYLKESSGKYVFKTKTDLVKIYNSVEGLHFAGASYYSFLDRISSKTSYELKEIWKLTNKGVTSDSTNPGDWEIYTVDGDLSNYFTNEASAANDNRILIEDNDVIRMVYGPKNSTVEQDLTMYDYDISDGQLRTSTEVTESYTGYITDQSNTTTAYMYTNGSETGTFFGTVYRGINSVVPASSNTATIRFAFGNNNTGTGLDDQTWNSINLNNSSKKGVFELASGVLDKDGDYIPVFADDIIMPNLFEGFNDHNREKFNASENKNVFTSLVAYYEGSNNGGAVSSTSDDDNHTFSKSHNPDSLTWKDLKGNHSGISVSKDEHNYFANGAYRTSGGKFYLPDTINNYIGSSAFTLELQFGDIRDTGTNTILFADDSGNKRICLSIEKGQLCFYKNGTKVNASNVMTKNNGYDLVAYSTIAITFNGSNLRLYRDGALIYTETVSGAFSSMGKLFIGSYDSSDACKHTTEYRSIRVHSTALNASSVKRNARYNASASLNLYMIADSTYSQDTSGKKVIGGRDIVFNRVGDTYTLSAINNTMGGTSSLGNLTNLEYFNYYSSSDIISNNFWPMDYSGTFGGDGHDIKFGSLNYQDYRKYFNSSTNGNLPVSIDQQDHNSYFGFKHKFDFHVDADYVGPLNFFFYGDDDVWVFLDDGNGNTQLVCDLGGVHNPVGEYVDLRDYIPNGTEGDYSLYMFYLERGGSQSTAYMRMTAPVDSVVLPTADETDVYVPEPTPEFSRNLEITNTVNNIDEPQPFLYSIQLFDEEGNALTGDFEYKIFVPTGEVLSSETVSFANQGENGIPFEIAHEHKLVLYNLPVGTQYKITQMTRNGFYTTYTVNDDEPIKGNVDKKGNVIEDKNTIVTGVMVDNKTLSVDFYNTNYAELPSTGFDGENSVLMYYVPFGIATVYMCAMPFINRTKKSKKESEAEQA